MEIDVFLHGVPNGYSLWPKKEDSEYFRVFYVTKDDQPKLQVEVRTLGNKLYCYYHYLLYKGVLANEGREGSYFAISVRVSDYCFDIKYIYQLLELAYKNHILNSILRKTKENLLMYTIPSFDSQEGIVKKIENFIIENINLISSKKEEYVSIAGFSKTNTSNSIAINLQDYVFADAINHIKKYGAITLSEHVITNLERRLDKKWESKIIEYNKKIELYEVEKMKYNSELDKYKNEINNLNNELRKRENELKAQKQSKRVEEIVSQISAPLQELVSIMNSIPRAHSTPFVEQRKDKVSHSKNNNYLKTLLLVLVSVLVTLVISFYAFKEDKETKIEATTQYTENKEDSITLDIREYNGTGALSKGKEYTVEAKNAIEEGTWEIKGAKLVDAFIKTASKSIKFKVTSDTVVIRFDVDGKVIERSIPDKKENE